MPVLKKLPGKKDQPKKSDEKSGDRVVLFDSESDSEGDDQFDFSDKNEKKEKKNKKEEYV